MFFQIILIVFNLNLFSNISIIYDENEKLPDEILINNNYDFSITINNNFSNKITIENIVKSGLDNNLLSIRTETPLNLNAGESAKVNFSLQINNNVEYNFLVDFNIALNNSKFSEYFLINTQGIISDYYKSTRNIYGDDLILELKKIIKEHTVHTYRNSRIFMWEDLHNINGTVECVYSGQTIQHTTGIPNVQQTRFNTEHTWPQSLGSDNEPPLSDLHHIFPTNEIANARRASYPFDYVTNSISWAEGGSTLGKNDKGETIFEVRDVQKGNTARAIFYFALKYGNNSNYLNSQEAVLKEWSYNDLPDEFELVKNDKIFEFQNNRNPFVDNPNFLDRVGTLSGGGFPELVNNIEFRDSKIILELDLIDNFTLNIFNSGSANVNITNIELPEFLNNVDFSNTILSRGEFLNYNVNYNSDYLGDLTTGNILITYNNNETNSIEVEIINQKSVQKYKRLDLYPNPSIDFIQIEEGFNFFECYDIYGNRILLNNELNIINTSYVPTGVYVLKVYYKNEIRIGKFAKI